MTVSKVLVYAESLGDEVESSVLEMLTKAQSLSDSVEAFYVGADADARAGVLGEYGASKVYALDPGDALPSAVAAAAIAEKAGEIGADLILFSTGYDARDVSGRLSVKLDVPVLTNATGLDVHDSGLIVETAIFGATKIVKSAFDDADTKIVLVRPKSFAAEPAGGGAAEVVGVAAPDAGAEGDVRVRDHHVEATEGPKLEDADIVVSGGRGLGSADAYKLVEELAAPLAAATGASRAIVDAGWVPYSKQVGQTGKTVKPTIYIALGISGAMQHMVGMKGSKHIIAINKDPDAPIHSIADLGIVGDVHKVVPQLVEALQSR